MIMSRIKKRPIVNSKSYFLINNKKLNEEPKKTMAYYHPFMMNTAKKIDVQKTISKIEQKNVPAVINCEKKKDVEYLCVVITTHNRTTCACCTIDYLIKNLKFPNIKWIISDDGSTEENHIEKLLNRFRVHNINDVVVCRTTNEKYGLGTSMNNGLHEAWKYSDVVLTVEDDWILQKELDIGYYYNMIKNDNTIAGIRLASLTLKMKSSLNSVTVDNSKYPDMLKIKSLCSSSVSWIFNNQVMLRHKRIYDAIGYYPDNVSPDAMEINVNKNFCNLTHNGYRDNYCVLFPKKLKTDTLDDQTLFFIHVGKSTMDHGYSVPYRYNYIYNPKKFFSIIIPTFNTSKEHLTRALESIKNQKMNDYVVTVIDDKSDTKYKKDIEYVCKKYPFVTTYFSCDHIDSGGCRNIGLKYNPNTEYTLFLDSDDYYTDNNVLLKLYDLIMKFKKPEAVLCSYTRCEQNNKSFKKLTFKDDYSLCYNIQSPWSLCFQTTLAREFVDKRKRFNDVVWYMRMCDILNIKKVTSTDFSVVNYTIGENKNSCQYGALDNRRVSAIYYLIADLIEEKFYKDDVNKCKQKILTDKGEYLKRNNMFSSSIQ